MALLKILHIPDMRLRVQTKAIAPEQFTSDLQKLIDDMIETMYAANGVGLAATQVGRGERVAVIDASGKRNPPLVLINPEITQPGDLMTVDEGCLSVPGHYDRVKRAATLTLRALDREQKAYEIKADGLLAQAVQHECDHLDGKLYIDYLSSFKQKRIRSKVEKFNRRSKE